MTQKYFVLSTCAFVMSIAMTTTPAPVAAQERVIVRSDLSGSWQLNRELSENAEAKLQHTQSSPRGGHGPGRHGGLLGRLFGGGHSSQMEEARSLFLNAPASFTVKQDGDRIILTGGDGRVRTLTANGRKEKVNGRDAQTRWDKERLVSEISMGAAKVTETYERSTNAPQLIVTTQMDMRGHTVSVRRVYDAASGR